MEQLKSFKELTLPAPIMKALVELKFKNPSLVQALGIPPALKGRDILGIAPTGTGKTAAYGIPAVSYLYPNPGKQVLILAPTRELATQIFRFMRKLGKGVNLNGTLLVGGESMSRQMAECKEGVDYIVATTGRLIDHLDRGLSLAAVGMLVVDEVDQMLTMGFMPEVKKILHQFTKRPQTFMFSATLPHTIQDLAGEFLRNPVEVTVTPSPTQAPQIHEEHIETTDVEKPRLLLDQVEARTGKILVFANTQGHVEKATRHLESGRQSVSCLHGGRTHGERKQALDAFRRGDIRILVATDIAARGIDVVDIAHVINYDNPNKREDYLHRIGRTARMGKTGSAITFIDETRKRKHTAAPRPSDTPNKSRSKATPPKKYRKPKPRYAKQK